MLIGCCVQAQEYHRFYWGYAIILCVCSSPDKPRRLLASPNPSMCARLLATLLTCCPLLRAAILLLGLVKEAIDYKRLGAHHTSLRAKAGC